MRMIHNSAFPSTDEILKEIAWRSYINITTYDVRSGMLEIYVCITPRLNNSKWGILRSLRTFVLLVNVRLSDAGLNLHEGDTIEDSAIECALKYYLSQRKNMYQVLNTLNVFQNDAVSEFSRRIKIKMVQTSKDKADLKRKSGVKLVCVNGKNKLAQIRKRARWKVRYYEQHMGTSVEVSIRCRYNLLKSLTRFYPPIIQEYLSVEDLLADLVRMQDMVVKAVYDYEISGELPKCNFPRGFFNARLD